MSETIMMKVPERFIVEDYGKRGATVHDKMTRVVVSVDEDKTYHKNKEVAIAILKDLTTPIPYGATGYTIIDGLISRKALSRWEFFDDTSPRLERDVSIALDYRAARYIALYQLKSMQDEADKEHILTIKNIKKLRIALGSMI